MKSFWPFDQARQYMLKQGLKSNREWRSWVNEGKRPDFIPSTPDHYYRGTWQGWGRFLGSGNKDPRSLEYVSFEECRKIAHDNQLKTKDQWNAWALNYAQCYKVPSNPSKVYAEWTTWGYFLGTGNIAFFKRNYRDFEQALAFARSLNIAGKEAWFVWSKSGNRPQDIPSNPPKTYAQKGWRNWKHWLKEQ